jgi:hypothetical protein
MGKTGRLLTLEVNRVELNMNHPEFFQKKFGMIHV